ICCSYYTGFSDEFQLFFRLISMRGLAIIGVTEIGMPGEGKTPAVTPGFSKAKESHHEMPASRE
ncbi:MAG: hypothetical protein IKX19_10215, partial [Clostridia bacterium]|nr:hypothetical protein [Clostridia bacterium]